MNQSIGVNGRPFVAIVKIAESRSHFFGSQAAIARWRQRIGGKFNLAVNCASETHRRFYLNLRLKTAGCEFAPSRSRHPATHGPASDASRDVAVEFGSATVWSEHQFVRSSPQEKIEIALRLQTAGNSNSIEQERLVRCRMDIRFTMPTGLSETEEVIQ
ncbi:hypothetical protein [Aporhodopirellula aestuarii]|uniref:hypothetical protein n=1 Tax=Aporhodopirellula aestuarii TaxID=2950107 RepID=UPI002034A6FA|nr:hypothetical protein [Aporhodopirellula aestuarii]